MKDEKMNYERAKIFCDKQLVVHISKRDGIYYNGIITEVSDLFFFLEDKEDGKQLIFFKELSRQIEEYKEVEEDDINRRN